MKRIAILASVILIAMTSYADEPNLLLLIRQKIKTAKDNFAANVTADVVSRYVWRGYANGDAAVQPSADLFYKGLNLNIWGNFGFVKKDDDREFDVTLSYTTAGFSAGVTDVWTTGDSPYFEYSSHKMVDDVEGTVSFGPTQHLFEGWVAYDLGSFCAEWHTVFAGNDGANKSGNRAYSSYFEVSAPFELVNCDWVASVGVVPWASTLYENTHGFSVTNVSLRCTKNIHIYKKFSIPVFGELSANPCTKNGFCMAGFTISPWNK